MADEAGSTLPEEPFDSVSQMNAMNLIAVSGLTFLLIFSFFALSLSNDSSPQLISPETVDSDDWRAFSVVAPVDTGINVYHDHFRTNETYPSWLLDELGVNKVCDLTFTGTWQERYDADRDTCWDTLTPSDIVAFPGTKIIGHSPDGGSEPRTGDAPQPRRAACTARSSTSQGSWLRCS